MHSSIRPRPLLLGVLTVTVLLGGGAGPKPPEVPAEIVISVSPETVAPGEKVRVSLRLEPIKGVKINRYPMIKLQVPAREGLVDEAEVTLGNSTPPPPEKMNTNYFEKVDPLELTLPVAAAAARGTFELEGKLTYYYCMPASGFCAPKRAAVKIPVVVR